MPLSASVSVNRDEFGALLQDAIDGLPEELREARWLLKERDEVLERAQPRSRPDHRGGAGAGRAHGRAQRGRARGPPRPRSRSSRTPSARPRAIRHEAEDYVDRKLAAFEVVLDRTMQTVQKGRERLQVHIDPREAPRPTTTTPRLLRPGRGVSPT